MTDWRDRLDAAQRKALRHSRMPAWTQPMLATLTDARFSSPDWIFERKLDGERCLVFRRRRHVQLLSRNRQGLVIGGYTEPAGLRDDKPARRVVREAPQ
jgi:bifunctional non-homologous end joining protein LigD